MKELKFKRGDLVVATSGFNHILKKPSEFLYEFGYYNSYNGAVVYKKGCCNMQDSFAFDLDCLRLATDDDVENIYHH